MAFLHNGVSHIFLSTDENGGFMVPLVRINLWNMNANDDNNIEFYYDFNRDLLISKKMVCEEKRKWMMRENKKTHKPTADDLFSTFLCMCFL